MSHYFENDHTVKSKEFEYQTQIKEIPLFFTSDNGVFSKNNLDFGTRSLLENIPLVYGSVLDLGCGYGPIGIYLKKKYDCSVDMVDINLRSLALASKNALRNGVDVCVFESNAYEKIVKQYDFIVTNPPIRVGKKILFNILIGAKEHLKTGGELWFVMHKDQGAKSCFQMLSQYYEMTLVKKNKGFYVICARKH